MFNILINNQTMMLKPSLRSSSNFFLDFILFIVLRLMKQFFGKDPEFGPVFTN